MARAKASQRRRVGRPPGRKSRDTESVISLVLKRDAMSEESIGAAREALRQTFFRTLGVDPPERPAPVKSSR